MVNTEKQLEAERANLDGLGADPELERKYNEIKRQGMILKLNNHKRHGILPDEIESQDIEMSIQEESEIQTKDENSSRADNKSWTEMIIVSKKNPIFAIEHFLYVICCLVSPYIYGLFVVFGAPETDSASYIVMICLESYFFLNIIFTFFVEFEIEGQVMPVRDLQRIAQNYL